MNQRRRLSRRIKLPSTMTGHEHSAQTLQGLLTSMLGADAVWLAGTGDEPCDAPRPPDLPPEVACRFRRGHRCACRYFGDLEKGVIG